MRKYARELRALGIQVTSTWHDDKIGKGSWEYQALRDLDDIHDANCLVMFTKPRSFTGGRHTEFGYALALGKRIILVGPKNENVFQAGVRRVRNWKDVKTTLANYASI